MQRVRVKHALSFPAARRAEAGSVKEIVSVWNIKISDIKKSLNNPIKN